MKKLIGYEVVTTNNRHFLESCVKEMARDGWELQGGVAIHVSKSEFPQEVTYYQAMVKYEKLQKGEK